MAGPVYFDEFRAARWLFVRALPPPRAGRAPAAPARFESDGSHIVACRECRRDHVNGQVISGAAVKIGPRERRLRSEP